MRYKFNEIAINSVEKRIPTEDDKANYIGLEHLESGSLSVSTWGSAVSLKGEKIVMRKGDVLFGKRNTYLRRASIAPHDGLFSAHGMVLRPKPEVIDPSFFPFFVNSDEFFNSTIRISVGSLSPTVNWKDMKELEFDLPPIEKQRELAELLWSANDLKESYKKLIVATDEMLKAKFREMFWGGGVMSAECGVGSRAETRREGDFLPFKDCYSKVLGGKTPSMSREDFYGGSVPFVKSGDVRGDYVASGSLRLTDIALKEGGAKYVPKGSVVVVVRSATLKNELRVAVAVEDVVINQDLKAFVPRKGFNSHFLMRAIRLRAPELLAQVKTMLTSHIDVADLDVLPIPQAPLALQQAFVEIARKADETKAAMKKSIADVEAVIKGLING